MKFLLDDTTFPTLTVFDRDLLPLRQQIWYAGPQKEAEAEADGVIFAIFLLKKRPIPGSLCTTIISNSFVSLNRPPLPSPPC